MQWHTRSDHSLVAVVLDFSYLRAQYSAAQARNKGYIRTIFQYEKATQENWDSYRSSIKKLLENKGVSEILLDVAKD